MKTLIATDGSLVPEQVLPFARSLSDGDDVTVLTVIEIPRTLLNDIRRVYGSSDATLVGSDAEYVGPGQRGASAPGWPGDDTIIERYLEDQGEQRAGSLAAHLRDAGLDVTIEVREGEDAASGVLAALDELQPDVVVAGATGRGLFQGLLGSTSTKLTRNAHCPVLIVRGD